MEVTREIFVRNLTSFFENKLWITLHPVITLDVGDPILQRVSPIHILAVICAIVIDYLHGLVEEQAATSVLQP